MWETIKSGGILVYPILLCSIVALGFIIERFLTFRSSRSNMEPIFETLENYIKLGKWEEAIKLCENSDGVIPKILLVGLKNKDENIEDIKRLLIDEVQIHALSMLNKNLGLLAVIAKIGRASCRERV